MLSYEFFTRFLLSKRAGALVRTISRISIIGIWLGITSLVIVISVMNGFNRSIQKRLLAVEPHLVVSFDEKLSTREIKEHDIYQKLSSEEGVELSLFAKQDVILRTPDGFLQGAVAHGVTRKTLHKIHNFSNNNIGDGTDSELQKKIEDLEPGSLIMGAGLADALGLFKGDTVVIIPPESLLLMSMGEVPVYTQGTVKALILTDVDTIDGKTAFYILDESFPRLVGAAGRERGIEVYLPDPYSVDSVKADIEQEGVKVATWKERNASLFFALKIEKLVISLLVGLSTLIAGFSIISVMVLLLTQKRKDIGNFLAMGMTIYNTKKLFIQVGMVLALVGVFGGILTGILGSYLIDSYSQDVLPAFYEETNIPAEVRWYQIVAILAIAVVFSFIALSLTLRKLTNIKPSTVLRG